MAKDVERSFNWNGPLPLFALADGNSFYNSAETIYQPWLRGRPLVTCSNGDGCLIALNPEAKALGLKMGTPRFQVEKFMEMNGVMWFSSNYEKYDLVSSDMHLHFSQYVPFMEVYSIDEAFFLLTGIKNYRELGRRIIDETAVLVRMPICFGIAPTKTLAKVANKLAKKDKERKGLYVIDTEQSWLEAVKAIPIGDIWGIGWEYEAKLKRIGVYTAFDFMRLPRKWVRKNMTVQGERLWRELHGEICYELEENPEDKKNTGTSRAFGEHVTTFHELAVAATRYLEAASRKVRKQGSMARTLTVGIETNRFNKEKPQYIRFKQIELPTGMNTTLQLLPFVMQLLKDIFPRYRPGQPLYEFKRVSVLLGRLMPATARQLDFFNDYSDYDKYVELQAVVDNLNHNRKMDDRLVQYGPSIIKNDKTIVTRNRLSKNEAGLWEDRITIRQEPQTVEQQLFA